jgi:hypothetical protein
MDRDGRDLIAEVTIDESEKGLQEPSLLLRVG